MNANIESALTALIGNDPRFQRAMAMLNGKTPVEMQQVVMNMISTQGMLQLRQTFRGALITPMKCLRCVV